MKKKKIIVPCLIQAIQANNILHVKELLNEGIDPNIEFKGKIALRYAIENQNFDIVKLLLSSGAQPTTIDLISMPLLIQSIYKNNLSLVNLLLKHGVDPNSYDYETSHTGLSCAVDCLESYDIVKVLLKVGADPNITFAYKSVPLISSVKLKSNEILQLLLKYKANPNIQDSEGNTALMVAASYGNVEAVKLLLKAGALVNLQNNIRDTALHNAAYYGEAKIISLLIKAGAKINVKNNKSKTPANELKSNQELDQNIVNNCLKLLSK